MAFLRKIQNIQIDYFTVRLPFDGSFTFDDFFNGLEEESQVDAETGEVSGGLAAHQYATRTLAGGVPVIMFFAGGEEYGMKLARNFNLRVTRLDIAIDFNVGSVQEQTAMVQQLAAEADTAITGRGWKVATSSWTNKGDAVNGHVGYSFWSRAGTKLLRVYGKQARIQRTEDTILQYVVRVEWELKQDLCRKVWDLLAEPTQPVNRILYDCFQTLVTDFLSPDVFGFGEHSERDLAKMPKIQTESSYEHWLLHTVARSIAGAFVDSGVDYCAMLAREVQRLLGNQEIENHRRLVTKGQRARRATKLQFELQTARRRTKEENAANLKEAMRKMEAENDDNE